MIQFSEAQITHVEIHGLTCQMVDASLKLIPSRSEKAIFQNEELYQYFKNPSKLCAAYFTEAFAVASLFA